jgi:hypothetical protein
MEKLSEIPKEVMDELSESHLSSLYGGIFKSSSINDSSICKVVDNSTGCIAYNNTGGTCTAIDTNSNCSVKNNVGTCLTSANNNGSCTTNEPTQFGGHS